MKYGNYEQASEQAEQGSETENGVRRMWCAVILQAIEDWQSKSLGRQSEAEKFFFQNQNDFAAVCRNAGLNPSSVVSKLNQMKQSGAHKVAFSVWQPA